MVHLTATAPVGTRLKLPKRSVVFIAGSRADRFFEVESGAVMLYRLLDDGRRQVVEVVLPGGICGLAGGALQESCCETLMPTTLRAHTNADLERSDQLRTKVIARLQTQIAAIHDHAVSLGRKTAQERISAFIVRIHGTSTAEAMLPDVVALPMSRTEMADYLGLTLETVCRTIADLLRCGLITLGGKKNELRIPNLDSLRLAAALNT